MSDKTAISWTDATWNPVTGCSHVSEGCRNCYAEDDNLSIDEIASAGQAHGLTWALSWELVMLNDETFSMVTPEYRYEAVLAWVRRRIDGGPG